jgi:hypothetical protein
MWCSRHTVQGQYTLSSAMVMLTSQAIGLSVRLQLRLISLRQPVRHQCLLYRMFSGRMLLEKLLLRRLQRIMKHRGTPRRLQCAYKRPRINGALETCICDKIARRRDQAKGHHSHQGACQTGRRTQRLTSGKLGSERMYSNHSTDSIFSQNGLDLLYRLLGGVG